MGFDCSGLTKAAYATAGVTCRAPPRPSSTRVRASRPGRRCCRAARLLRHTRQHPPRRLYIGGGLMMNAPTFGHRADRQLPSQQRRLRRGNPPGGLIVQ
ncbi:hypothetical protein [Lentzea sp. CC55]|uniref:hypothetical protein n=1 Tax=Lentzea sp. CC55 TaxID=2884909 RepID=UPI0035B01822